MANLLAVVDYQNDFVNGALGFAGAELLEPGIMARIRQTLAQGDFVLFTRDTHPQGYLQTREGAFLPLPHCIQGTHGHQLYGQLHSYEVNPQPHTLIIDKPTFGCANIGAEAIRLCGGEPEVVDLCGLVTDICVVANAIILHTQLPHARIRVLQPLVGSGNERGAQCALELLQGMGIEIVQNA